jgi:hypothetical protein
VARAAGREQALVSDGDVTAATFGYLGAIFLGPVIPLIVYVIRARRSPFTRYLISGVAAANHGDKVAIPSWLCARIVS